MNGQPTNHQQLLRPQDWEHRVEILQAWRLWSRFEHGNPTRSGAQFCGDFGPSTYRAVFDGCASTVRAIMMVYRANVNFTDFDSPHENEFEQRKAEFCRDPRLGPLARELRENLFEVLYLANRAVAHAHEARGLDHRVDASVMTGAITALLNWLQLPEQRRGQPGLDSVFAAHPGYFAAISEGNHPAP